MLAPLSEQPPETSLGDTAERRNRPLRAAWSLSRAYCVLGAVGSGVRQLTGLPSSPG